MSATTSALAPPPDTTTETHPARGALWGLMMGVGLAIVLVITKVIYLDVMVMAIVVGACVVVGVLWGSLGPAKPPAGPAPVVVTSVTTRASDDVGSVGGAGSWDDSGGESDDVAHPASAGPSQTDSPNDISAAPDEPDGDHTH